jgi:hypothetical protein
MGKRFGRGWSGDLRMARRFEEKHEFWKATNTLLVA